MWNDLDDDGIIDPDEPGIPGVAVKLILAGENVAGEVVQRSVSALDGTFRFADPLPGTYTVEVALPAGTRTSSVSWADQKTADNGIDNGGGQRVVGTAVTPPIVIGTSDSSDATAATIANVGVFAPLPAVEVEVYANGCRADEPTDSTGPIGECVTDSDDGPVVPVGSSVLINAVIRNSGNVALANAQVAATMSAGATTATPAPIESGSLDCNGFLDGDGQPLLLEVGDVVTCSAEMRVVAGQQSLTATLSATSERDPGVTDSFVSEPDVAAWFGGSGGLDLDAFVVTQRPGLDADGDGFIDPQPGTATGPGENPVFGVPEFTMTSVDDAPRAGGADFTANHVVAEGDPLWWLYRVTNRGPGPLDSLSISVDGDVLCGGVGLPAGESAWCMTSERATVSGQLRRTATATANESTVATGIPIRVPPASAMAHAFVPSPGLAVTTFVDGIDAAQGPVPRDAGSSVTLTYLIENVGDFPFGSVLLSDDSVGVIDCPELTAGLRGLQPGEVIGCSTVIAVPVLPGDETLPIVVTAEATPIPLVPVPPPAADAADDAPAASPAVTRLPAVVVEATTTIDPVTAAVLKRVWIDGDGDGVFDSSEQPVAELNVALLDDVGEVAATTTDAAGRFAFADLEPDVYAIAYTIPSGLASATVLADRSVAIAGPVVSDPVRLGGVADNPAWDVALVETGPVVGVAWADDDADGERDESEAVLTGATVLLRDSHGGTVDATLTDDSGSYRFENVPPAGRRAEVVPGSARVVSGVAAGAEPAALTGRVWDDVDGDQRRPQIVGVGATVGVATSDGDAVPEVDASAPADAPIDVTPSNATRAERVAAGVIVSLFDGDGELLALTETDRSGTYRFPGVGAGTVQVLLGLYPSLSISPSGDTASATVAVGPGDRRSVVELFVPPNRRFELVPDARSVADDPDPSGRAPWVPENADEVLLGLVFIAAAVLAAVVLASARRRGRPV